MGRFCTIGLASDVIVEVGDMSFHLHKGRRAGSLGAIQNWSRVVPQPGRPGAVPQPCRWSCCPGAVVQATCSFSCFVGAGLLCSPGRYSAPDGCEPACCSSGSAAGDLLMSWAARKQRGAG